MSHSYDQWSTAGQWASRTGQISAEEHVLFQKYIGKGKACLDYGCGDAAKYPGLLVSLGAGYPIQRPLLRAAMARTGGMGKLLHSGASRLWIKAGVFRRK